MRSETALATDFLLLRKVEHGEAWLRVPFEHGANAEEAAHYSLDFSSQRLWFALHKREMGKVSCFGGLRTKCAHRFIHYLKN